MSGSNSNFGNSIFDAITNPGVDALLGMTQGFAQAALPTRMPTPWGAVLGMGVGGALPGISAGQQLRHAGIANQQAQMGLDWYKNMMGPQASGNSGMTPTNAAFGAPNATDANGQYLISPGVLASMAQLLIGQGKDPSGVMKLIESYSGGNGYAMGRGGQAFAVPGGAADPGVAGTLAAAKAYGEGSGGARFKPPITIKVPDGKGGFVEQTMTIPQGNQYLSGQGENGGGGTAASGAIPASDWASRLNGTENATGNPAAKNPNSSATGNGQFLDSTWIDQTRKAYPTQTANMSDADLLKLRADPILSHQMTMAYGAENANVLAQNGIQPNATTLAAAHKLGPNDAVKVLSVARTAPQTPLSAVLSPDVIKANPQFQRQTAGNYVFGLSGQFGASPVDFGRRAAPQIATNAPTQGAVPTGMVAGPGVPQPVGAIPPSLPPAAPGVPGPPIQTMQEMRPGGMSVLRDASGRIISTIKNPEHFVVENGDGTKTLGHMAPPPPGSPEGTPGTFVPVQQLDANGRPLSGNVGQNVPPDVQEARNHVVTEFLGKDQDAYAAAKNTQGWLNQIDHAADVMNKAGGAYQSGNFAPTRLALMSSINDIGRTAGVGSPFDQNAIASAEELRKATTTAGFELSSHYEGHARQAAATIQNATSAVPGMSNSPLGVKLVSAGINEGAQSAIDVHEYKQARYNGTDPYGINPKAVGQAHGAGLETAETDFYKKFTPEMYSTRAISTMQPVKIDTLDQSKAMQEFQKYLPGTMVVFPNGKHTIVPPRADAPPIPGYIQRRMVAGGQ